MLSPLKFIYVWGSASITFCPSIYPLPHMALCFLVSSGILYSSEIVAIRHLMNDEIEYNPDVVDALLSSINILQPGVCVEMTNGDRGLVIAANNNNVLEPFVLSFRDNKVHNLGDSSESKELQIKDIMKTMDNRHVVDNDMLAQYTGGTVHMGKRNETKNF